MDICCRCTLELPLWGNSNVYQQHMLLKLMRPVLKYTLNKYHVHWLSPFKHIKLPISIKIPVTIWQIVYIYMPTISPNLISWTMLLLSCYLRGCIECPCSNSLLQNIIVLLAETIFSSFSATFTARVNCCMKYKWQNYFLIPKLLSTCIWRIHQVNIGKLWNYDISWNQVLIGHFF